MQPMSVNGSTVSQSLLDDCRSDRPAATVTNSAPAPLWELRGGLTPNASVQRILVATQPFTIGRDLDNSLCLANPTISRRHAELLFAETDLFIKDLGSRNGTYLNGRRVEKFERLQDGDMIQFGAAIFTVHPTNATPTVPPLPEQCVTAVEFDMGDYALANLEFDRLLTDHAVVPHFQPIVRLDNGQKVGYEVLARSRLVGLETPSAMFRVAAERNLEAELSDLVRRESLAVARALGLDAELYVNTHPAELHREGLADSLRRLREQYPTTPVVLEIHEGAVTSSQSLANLRARLKDLGMRLAYDDFGAGQSRLMELADVPPDVLKFDMRMIHGLSHASDERQNMVRSLVTIVRNLGVVPLAEGIETGDESVICRDLGFELAQGYFFGRPTAAPSPRK